MHLTRIATLTAAVLALAAFDASAHDKKEKNKEKKAPPRPYTLSLDALVGADGTDVVLKITSSGAFALPGEAEHVVLWSTNARGRITWARWMKDLPLADGQAVLPGLAIPVHTPLSAAVAVKVAGSRAAQLLQANTVALYRPDLRIGHVNAPAEARVGQLVNVEVVVQESRGHRGASFDVLLTEGDVVLDAVTGASIEPMGTTTALFTLRFPAAGARALRAVVTNVAPGDYDASNNSAGFGIRVADVTPAAYALGYRRLEGEFSDNFESTSKSSVDAPGRRETTVLETGSRYEEIGRHESLNYTSTVDAFISGVIRFSARIVADGRERVGYSITGWSPRFSDGGADWGQVSYQAFDPETNANVYVDSSWSTKGSNTTVTYSRSAGDYTFHSSGYRRFWSEVCLEDPATGQLICTTESSETTTEDSGHVMQGSFVDAFANIRMQTELGAGDAVIGGWTQEHAVTLTTVDRTWDETLTKPGESFRTWGYERRTVYEAAGGGTTTP